MHKFAKDFKALNYVIRRASKILLFAHSRPDADTTGSCLALREHLLEKGKLADVACFDPYPEHLNAVFPFNFEHPKNLNLKAYDAVIACDSVERGFEKIYKFKNPLKHSAQTHQIEEINKISESQVVILLDHHPDISLRGDINIIDPAYSSVCEIVYDYLEFCQEKISKNTSTFLLLGILADTGNFRHSNTTARVMKISSDLMRRGANISKIVKAVFANKKLSTLRLWGRAFEKARIDKKSRAIVTVLTRRDLDECQATNEDIAQVATILSSVPDTRFALVLSERGDGLIKGSLRSEEYKGVDVSKIAARLGGGGHKLASGFEIKGRIVETEDGWQIV